MENLPAESKNVRPRVGSPSDFPDPYCCWGWGRLVDPLSRGGRGPLEDCEGLVPDLMMGPPGFSPSRMSCRDGSSYVKLVGLGTGLVFRKTLGGLIESYIVSYRYTTRRFL